MNTFSSTSAPSLFANSSAAPAPAIAGNASRSHTVNCNDTIFAVVKHCGRIIYTTTLGGMSSVEEVIRILSRSLRNLAQGLVTVILRNGSQGWLHKQGLVVGRTVMCEGQQLSLF